MSRDQQRLVDYLAHILEAIGRIQRYTEDMAEQVFVGSQLVQDAVIHNFEIIGEASNNIMKHYPAFAMEHPELPLAFAYQMRNSIAHGYFAVDLEIVWRTIHSALPELSLQIQKAQTSIASDGGILQTSLTPRGRKHP